MTVYDLAAPGFYSRTSISVVNKASARSVLHEIASASTSTTSDRRIISNLTKIAQDANTTCAAHAIAISSASPSYATCLK
ncbi:hypothetical protein GV67_08365 [Pseudorhizobium pelagicum]|uniref:Uncharacterized protein n=1 Tax=Pseudorhizobium pelagicum TaxID=1509405 RepID=A0A922P0C5_9HYPH|nr:hypothetical protein GV67_08365 [Pseudorhizobium pelagicum]KEQ06667.1 hypothetical protein GV68_06340 [Pseudorhizobium pelagicum]